MNPDDKLKKKEQIRNEHRNVNEATIESIYKMSENQYKRKTRKTAREGMMI